ncbi:serine:threonine protein kinase SIK3 [Echinococcus multilocularis]|uniref:non-specific serine/threonine protein kinase n=1 Tax=Echinococcus multilocularis TaxID=6211 RepID=A0A068YMJ1_ECHMU|nr:serine:threonine protein kinase SIK3 [Echinococcus multilocularis]
MHSGDTPRRHLLRQEEQQEESPAFSSSNPQRQEVEGVLELQSNFATNATDNHRPQTMTSGSSTTTSATTTTTSSSSSSSTSTYKTCGIRLKHSRVAPLGGGSTTSSSTEDSEAREQRFGSVDLQHPLPLNTATSGAIGQEMVKGQLTIDAHLKQALLADFSVFCPVHSQTSAAYNPQLRGVKKYLPSLFHSPAVLSTYFPRLLPTRSTDSLHPPNRFIDPLTTSTTVGPYHMRRLLGRGNFAVVKLATHTQLNVPVAVKIINKELVGGQNLTKISRELEAMKRCYRHPNIIRLYHIMETDANIYMVTEYASRGEVFDHISLSHAFTEKEARELFWQIVCAIDYCHKLGIVHRDLKAENLLIDADFKIKVADFGFCNFFTPEHLLTTHCGSPQYAAPELFKGESYDGPLVDVWSLGVILYILVCGSFPFPGESLGDIRSQVLRGLVRFPFFLSSACEQVIRGMLQVEPSRRLRLAQVTTTPWMQASPNLAHYTGLLAQYTSKARQQQADLLLQQQFPEHSSVVSTTRCQRRMDSLDGGLVRALALATGANEEEIRRSTAQRCFDRLHAGYALLVDKMMRFIANPRLREVVETWIRSSAVVTTMTVSTTVAPVSPTPTGVEEASATVPSSTAKLTSWREVAEEDEEEEEDTTASPKVKQKPKFDEDEDVSITASAVQNLSVSKSRALDNVEVGEGDKSVHGSVESAPIPPSSTSDLLNSWVDDFRARRTDVRIALSILQTDETQLLEEISDMEPDSTSKNIRRHTIQLPGPVILHHLPDDLQMWNVDQQLKGDHQKQEEGGVNPNLTVGGGGEVEAAVGGKKGSVGGRFPRQTTQPELGSRKPGLQREAPGNMVGESNFHWLPLVSVSEATAKFNITDVKELSLDLGQEAANTQPPPRTSLLPTNFEELTEPARQSPNLQINLTADHPSADISKISLSTAQFGAKMLGEGFNVSETCWDNLPHCSTREPLPQLDLPACIPSMSHQPVALFTFKDPNLLAPPEFMTPYSSSFPRRSSDGAADMPTLHRPYPLFGGSYPEQANYRTESACATQMPSEPPEGHMADESTEPINLAHIEIAPSELTNQQARWCVAHQDTLTTGMRVIPAQKRFSLPLRPAPSLVEHFSVDKEMGKNYVCCCDQLVNTFLAENQGKVSLEAINAFKISLLQQGSIGPLGVSEGTDNHGLGAHESMTMRRGSEATQMRIWNQRIAQLYGTSYTPLRRNAFSRWLSYETRDQLEALSQVKRQELRASASANVPKAVQLERSVETQRSGSVPFAHRHQKSPKRIAICRVDSQHSLAMAESSESPDLGASALKRAGREGDAFRGFRPHSSWNEKLTAGNRRRQTLPRSKSQVSWTDVKRCDSIGLRDTLVDPAATEAPSPGELSLPLATPMDITPSGEVEPPSTSIPSPTSSATSITTPATTHGGRRRQPNVVERKLNLDFLTSPRHKLYHDWLPKVSVISKRAVAALSNVCPRLPETSAAVVQEQLSPSAPGHPTPQNLILTPPELTISNSPPSPEAMSDSPTDLPSTETEDSPSTFHNFHHRTSMLMSPFPSKLQIRCIDEDEDLAVIDQVNRRLALGQLEPSLPWVPVPPGAGLLGYPPSTTEQYSESFAEAVFQHQQHQEMMSSMMVTAATSFQSGQCFFPMETTLPIGSGESVQYNLASRVFYQPEGNAQLSPPVEDPQSEVEFTDQ